MKNNNIFIFDTNAIISSFLLPRSTSRRAFDKAFECGTFAASEESFDELCNVIIRNKFDKYASINDREDFIAIHKKSLLFVAPTEIIAACRDPKDNKFLELAVAANAACIITGDADLLELHPFRNIPILNTVDFLNYEL